MVQFSKPYPQHTQTELWADLFPTIISKSIPNPQFDTNTDSELLLGNTGKNHGVLGFCSGSQQSSQL